MNIKIKLLYKLNLETFFLILVDLFSYKHFLIIIILIKPYQTLNIKGKFKKNHAFIFIFNSIVCIF